MGWSCHQEQIAILQKNVALIKAIVIAAFTSRFVDVGEIGKVKAPVAKFVAIDSGFAGVVEVLQNAAVPAKHVDDRAHVVGFGAVDAIVVVGAAVIVTKFLIGPSLNKCPTFLAKFVNVI